MNIAAAVLRGMVRSGVGASQAEGEIENGDSDEAVGDLGAFGDFG